MQVMPFWWARGYQVRYLSRVETLLYNVLGVIELFNKRLFSENWLAKNFNKEILVFCDRLCYHIFIMGVVTFIYKGQYSHYEALKNDTMFSDRCQPFLLKVILG